MSQVLIVEDEPVLARNVRALLGQAGYLATAVGTGEQGIEAAESNPPDIVLLDLRLPGMDGMEVMRELRRRGNSASVIIMTAYGNIDGAVEAMKIGASDYLTKPLDLKELELVVERVLRHRRMTANLDYLRRRERDASALERIIGDSEPMLAIKRMIERLVSTPALASTYPPTVLLTGETGTGKDLVARAVHYAGPRREAPFVAVNCTALPEHLVEAELFGYVKGAFTDARGDKRGLFEVADGGTLFLDEVGHMKPAIQAKLLSALEDRAIRPVGGTAERKINVHVIAATNRNLDEAIKTGEFRDDLYHRLRVLTIHVPPLRDRRADLDELVEHFVRLCATRFGLPAVGVSDAARDVLRAYDWPGNVRELSHTIENAVLIADGPMIRVEHLNIQPPGPDRQMGLAIEGNCNLQLDFGSPNCPKLEEIEHQVIRSALEYSQHNLSRAARILGISRDAVRYRMDKYGGRGASESKPEV